MEDVFKVRCAAGVIGAVILATMGALPATAATNYDDSPDVSLAKHVFASADPGAAFQELAPEQQAKVLTVVTPSRVDTAQVVNDALPVNATDTCWSNTLKNSVYSTANILLFTYWGTARWCWNGSTVTSGSFVDQGGQAVFVGWRYDGVNGKGNAVIANKAQMNVGLKFALGINGWDVQTPTYCIHATGVPQGLSSSGKCGI